MKEHAVNTSTDVLFVYVTVPSEDEGKRMAKRVVAERLAACANMTGPVWSSYWWQGKVEEAEERAVIFKTTKDRYADLEKRLLELHPYETPCIVGLPVAVGFHGYLTWVGENVTP